MQNYVHNYITSQKHTYLKKKLITLFTYYSKSGCLSKMIFCEVKKNATDIFAIINDSFTIKVTLNSL
jgi:hypothetical protein